MTVDPSTLTPQQRVALLETTLAELENPSNGWVLVGGEDAQLLWYAPVDSFTAGIWVATILCAQATCERALAGIVSLRELPGYAVEAPKGWEKWGLGTMLKHVRGQGWVPDNVLDDVEVLCEAPSSCESVSWPKRPTTLQRRRCGCTSAITPKGGSSSDAARLQTGSRPIDLRGQASLVRGTARLALFERVRVTR